MARLWSGNEEAGMSAAAHHPGTGRDRRRRRDGLLQARPVARSGVQAGAAGDPARPARTPASTRARSTASPPTATTATIPRGSPRRSACPSCASPTCSGAAAAAAARPRWATRRPRWPRATADCVVVFRALAQGQFQRFGAAPPGGTVVGRGRAHVPYGVMSPAQRFAMRAMRFMHDHGIAAGGAARHRARLLPSRAGQPARGDARPAAHRGGLRRLALDRRAVPPVRLLPWRTTARPR